ncbi:unnamed protein product [Rangifer tarandus platyrhynchus]|uniref:Uncharacterized protein n=2 Tax=Rangifer tarandus platyrhynchus TaxID=3082113 RepID=A0AC59ZF66_RANTA|nr:unnamed protein product [Rangifer tarandus platyrhynchus]
MLLGERYERGRTGAERPPRASSAHAPQALSTPDAHWMFSWSRRAQPVLTLLASWPGADVPLGLAEKGSPWRCWDPVFLPSASFSFPLALSWGRGGPYSFQGRTAPSTPQSLSRDLIWLLLLLVITPLL